MSYWQLQNRANVLSASDPSSVFVLKSLLYPLLSVLTLLVCLMVWNVPLYGPYFLVAVLAFAGAADFLEVAPLEGRVSLRDAARSLADIVGRWLVVFGFIWALLKLSGIAKGLNSHLLVAWAVSTPLLIWCGQLVAQRVLPLLGLRYAAPRRVVIVGATELGHQLAESLSNDELGRRHLLGFFDDDAEQSRSASPACRMLGDCDQLADYVANNRVDVVYITLPMTRNPRIVAILDALRDSTASIYFVPDLQFFHLIQPRFDVLNGLPVVAVCESPFYGVRGAAKRLADIAIAGVAVLALSPIFLAVMIAIRLESPGAVIFRQRRYGLDGREIVVYKFRSMRVTEDGHQSYTQVTRGDPRVTAVGTFIRKTSLDEIPQLFNVLEGGMSIVGPRPHAIAVNEQYRRLIPGYMVRHKVKPGITGWAQVNGYRGGDDIESMSKRIAFDLEYLRRWSLGLDFLIMLRTATTIWNDRRAY
jgi:putative colanic acid biosysnthesis UDP-glucose lipid carrier transferase